MINSVKLQLTLVLLLACHYIPLSGAEPNEYETELKFDIRQGLPQSSHLRIRPGSTQGVYKHYAVLFVRGDWVMYNRSIPIEEILETSAGQSMSQFQRDVISNQSIRFKDNGLTISDYTYFQLFGVSEDDVKKMVKAFIEIIANHVNENTQNLKTRKNEYSTKITEVKRQLTEKQKQHKETEDNFEKIKRIVYYLSPEEAKKTVEKLNTTLDELNIEIAGMQIKLKAIDEEHAAASAKMKSVKLQEIYQNTIWPKLELMRIDQIIDLRVAQEKRKIAYRIRQEAEQFYKLYEQNIELKKILMDLNDRLSDYQESLQDIERRLTTQPELSPPKVFQNKVTIYPVE